MAAAATILQWESKVKHLGIIMQIFQHSVDLCERVLMRRFLEGIDES